MVRDNTGGILADGLRRAWRLDGGEYVIGYGTLIGPLSLRMSYWKKIRAPSRQGDLGEDIMEA